MRVFLFLLLLSLSSIKPAAAAESPSALKEGEEAYRLSGLVVTPDGRNLAIVELADGKQLLLRTGDRFGDKGEVLEIGQRLLRLGFPDGEKVLHLSGYNGPQDEIQTDEPSAIADQMAVRSADIAQDLERTAAIIKREIAAEPLLSQLKEQQAAVDSGEIDDLTTLLAPLLDLAPEVRIVGINHAAIGSVREALEKLSISITAGSVVKLNTADAKQIYLMPRSEPLP